MNYDLLNKEQQQAVFHTEGPVLILAGAGSGKTRVITHRIAYLMEECGVNPWNILAITFTNKAAGEMKERVEKLIGFGGDSVWVSTFHSMCVRILRRHIDKIGYDTSFTIYDSDDQKKLMKEVCKKLRIDTKELKEKTILNAVSAAKDELLTPLRYRDEHRQTFQQKQIGEAYEEYQRLLQKNNALDFDDLLMKTVELFRSHEEILENYQERFKYIMVDEYQDTNTAQFELIRLLAGKYRNLCVVGDDDQSIYKFRGANIRNILDFEKVYPDALVVKLEQNYRSTQNVLDAANKVISHNSLRKEKALWTGRGEGSKLHLRQFNTAMEEASFIAEDIDRQKRKDARLSYKDFAVLYRTNAQARLLEERFIMGSIPYNVVGGTNFYERREIKDILAYLKTIDNGRDDIAVQRIINVPRRGIGASTLEKIADYAAERDISFFEALEAAAEDKVSGLARAKAKLVPFVEMIHGFRSYLRGEPDDYALDLMEQIEKDEDPEHPLSYLLELVLAGTAYEEDLKESDEEDAQDRIDNIAELLSKLVSYEDSFSEEAAMSEDRDGRLTLSGFLEEVALVADIDNVDGDADKVLLMTLHGAKGLEFSHVYLSGMEDGIFPSFMSINSEDEDALEEERRLAYVGITRAKDDLTLTAARSRMTRGEVQYNPISRFILEIPEELMDESARIPKKRPISSWEDEEDPFETGSDSFGSRNPGGIGRSSFGSGSASGSSFGRNAFGRPVSELNTHEPSYGRGEFNAAVQRNSDRSGRNTAGIDRSYVGSSYGMTRPKASYVKPHTPEAKKPFIAKGGSTSSLSASSRGAGASGLKKGMPAISIPDYTVGDRVSHIKFGVGTVTAMEKGPKDYKVTVNFDDAGQKIMYAAFAKLEKI